MPAFHSFLTALRSSQVCCFCLCCFLHHLNHLNHLGRIKTFELQWTPIRTPRCKQIGYKRVRLFFKNWFFFSVKRNFVSLNDFSFGHDFEFVFFHFVYASRLSFHSIILVAYMGIPYTYI